MKRLTAGIILAVYATLCTGCTAEEAISNAEALLSDAAVIMEEQESLENEFSYEYETETEAEVTEAETTFKEETVAEQTIPVQTENETETQETTEDEYSLAEETFDTEVTIDKDGVYTTKEDVALYIYTYECLPNNFISKNEAKKLGWEGGSLEPYAPGMCIGGSRFGNYEGLLPEADGRTYTECDIDTLGASKRGAKRIVFSNDGLIYYTEDHYESFELLYGEE